MLKKPENGGTPAIASAATSMVRKVIGMRVRSPPIFAHVLLAAEAVDHAAGAEEEERLEEGVGHQVEHGRAGRRRRRAPRNM